MTLTLVCRSTSSELTVLGQEVCSLRTLITPFLPFYTSGSQPVGLGPFGSGMTLSQGLHSRCVHYDS